MQTKKAVKLNTIVNVFAAIFVLAIITAGYWIYTNQQNAKDLYKNVFKLVLPQEKNTEAYKTIEITMYDQPQEKLKNIAVGLQKKENGKIIAEILKINTAPTQKITKIMQTTKIVNTRSQDATVELKILAQEKNGEYYFDNKKINLGDEFTIAFDGVIVNGTVMRISQ